MNTFVEAKMNQYLLNVKKSSLVLLFLVVGNSITKAESLKINWADNSINEDGFMIEKRFIEYDGFELISTLPANTNNYTDYDTVLDQSYCYRVVAFNVAGEAASSESCFQANDAIDAAPPESTFEKNESNSQVDSQADPIDTAATISISHEFINKPSVIEIGKKELYSFNSNEVYNESYSSDGIYNVEFSTNKGKVDYLDRDYFSFHQDGDELVNGFAMMGFNTGNKLSFDLQSNGTEQTATLYMQAGVWSNEVSNVIVTVGDQVENITLPRGYTWSYFSVDIKFDGTAPVTITTDSDRDGYSSVMFAGIVLNEPGQEAEEVIEAVQYASLLSVDTNASTTIDVTNTKFMTYAMETGNSGLSEASVEQLSFYGNNSASTSRFEFINDNGENFYGYQGMDWNEENGVTLKLQSGDSQVNTVSLYFSAGAWTNESALIEITINGESEFIEFGSAYSWNNYQVDIEFEGELNIDIHPVGKLSEYSGLLFAGVTIN